MSLIEKLHSLGLTLQEAKMYIASIQLGEAKVSELARISNVERAEGYRVLKRLQERGLVEELVDKPRRFRVYPPERAVNQLIKSMRNEVQLLKNKKKQMVEKLRSLAKVKTELIKEVPTQTLRVTGFENISRAIDDTIKTCERDFVAILEERALNRDISVLKWLKRTRKREIVKVRVLGTVTKNNMDEAKQLAKYIEIKHLNNVHTRIAVCDSGDIIISLSEARASEIDSILLIKSNEQASILLDLFDAAWEKATPLQMRLYELEKGITLGDTKVIKGKENITETFLDIVKRAKTQIMFLADPTFLEGIFSILDGKKFRYNLNKDIKMTILTDMNEMNRRLFQNFPNIELRHLEKPRSRIIISDDEILMGAIMEEEIPNEAIWSNSEGIVNAMKNILKVHFDSSVPVTSG